MTRLLVKCGTVLTMDPGVRPHPADVIVAVEPGIEADAEVIDARGTA